MAGRGPAPDAQRLRRGAPARGDWTPSPDGGWQHPLPEPPPGLLPSSAAVWEGWFRSWWAGNWTQDDLPVLRLTVRLLDRVMRGDVRRLGELRQWMDSCGLTFKGRQDRRWQAPPQPRSSRLGIHDPGRFANSRCGPDRPPAKERFRDIEERSAVDRFLEQEDRAQSSSVRERFAVDRDNEPARVRLAGLEAEREEKS